jgi:hypothetical protein
VTRTTVAVKWTVAVVAAAVIVIAATVTRGKLCIVQSRAKKLNERYALNSIYSLRDHALNNDFSYIRFQRASRIK